MSWWAWVLLGGAVWAVFAAAAGVVFGKALYRADCALHKDIQP